MTTLRPLRKKSVKAAFCVSPHLDTSPENVYNDVVGYTGLSRFARALLFCEIYSHFPAFPRVARGLASA